MALIVIKIHYTNFLAIYVNLNVNFNGQAVPMISSTLV